MLAADLIMDLKSCIIQACCNSTPLISEFSDSRGGLPRLRLAKDQSCFSTRIKDAGIAIRHSRGYTFFYTAGSRNGFEGFDNRGTDTQKEVDPEKNTLFCC